MNPSVSPPPTNLPNKVKELLAAGVTGVYKVHLNEASLNHMHLLSGNTPIMGKAIDWEWELQLNRLSNASTIEFSPVSSRCSVTGFILTGGNAIFIGKLSAPVVLDAGDSVNFAPSTLTIVDMDADYFDDLMGYGDDEVPL